MAIDTGVVVNPAVAPEDRVAGKDFTDNILLPAPPGAMEPGSFTVADGTTVLLTAYGLQPGQFLPIEKMLYAGGSVGGQVKCGCFVQGTTPARVNAVTLCNFSLGTCTEIRAISVPGRYRVIDPDEITGEEVIVTIAHVEKAQIPSSLLYGG